jgi:hypothetical protein
MLLFVVIMNYLLLLFQLIDSIGYRLPLLLLNVGQSVEKKILKLRIET